MRLTLSNTLRTRPGDYLKDARLVNAYPDIKNEEATARKRPGCNPAGFDFTTPPQGFSSIADLMTDLPYGAWGDISGLLFTIGNDSYSITDIHPKYNPAKTYAAGDMVIITSSTAVLGETEAGEIFYADMPINPADPRHRPNYNFNDVRYPTRGKGWSKIKPSGGYHYATFDGYSSGTCGSMEGAGFSAWCKIPNGSPATAVAGSWCAFDHIEQAPSWHPYYPAMAVWGQQWAGGSGDINMGVAVRGTAS